MCLSSRRKKGEKRGKKKETLISSLKKSPIKEDRETDQASGKGGSSVVFLLESGEKGGGNRVLRETGTDQIFPFKRRGNNNVQSILKGEQPGGCSSSLLPFGGKRGRRGRKRETAVDFC